METCGSFWGREWGRGRVVCSATVSLSGMWGWEDNAKGLGWEGLTLASEIRESCLNLSPPHSPLCFPVSFFWVPYGLHDHLLLRLFICLFCILAWLVSGFWRSTQAWFWGQERKSVKTWAVCKWSLLRVGKPEKLVELAGTFFLWLSVCFGNLVGCRHNCVYFYRRGWEREKNKSFKNARRVFL